MIYRSWWPLGPGSTVDICDSNVWPLIDIDLINERLLKEWKDMMTDKNIINDDDVEDLIDDSDLIVDIIDKQEELKNEESESISLFYNNILVKIHISGGDLSIYIGEEVDEDLELTKLSLKQIRLLHNILGDFLDSVEN